MLLEVCQTTSLEYVVVRLVDVPSYAFSVKLPHTLRLPGTCGLFEVGAEVAASSAGFAAGGQLEILTPQGGHARSQEAWRRQLRIPEAGRSSLLLLLLFLSFIFILLLVVVVVVVVAAAAAAIVLVLTMVVNCWLLLLASFLLLLLIL